MIERISQLLTELMGSPVTNADVTWMVIIAVGSLIALLFATAWKKSGQIDWEAVEEERKRLEEED